MSTTKQTEIHLEGVAETVAEPSSTPTTFEVNEFWQQAGTVSNSRPPSFLDLLEED